MAAVILGVVHHLGMAPATPDRLPRTLIQNQTQVAVSTDQYVCATALCRYMTVHVKWFHDMLGHIDKKAITRHEYD